MAFFDDMVGKMTNFGQDVAKKGKNISDTAKLSSELRNLENEKNNCLMQLGQIFYLQYSDVMDAQSRTIKERIDDIALKTEQIQQQIQQLRGVVRCPNCQREVSVNSAFCNFCGTKIEHRMVPPVTMGKQCPNCGVPVEEDQMFCVNCGYRLNDGNNEPSVNGQTVPEKKICPSCGAVLDAGQAFCNQCGKRLDAAEEAPINTPAEPESGVETEAPQPQVVKRCPNCGTEVEEDQAFCVGCGTPLK